MTRSLRDKVVFITGASSGFGAEAARLFAKERCQVILTARRIERLDNLAEEIRRGGGKAFAFQMDVTEQSQIDHVVSKVVTELGHIDILLNNAGLGRLDWLEMLDPVADINMQIDVNLRGTIQVTRSVLPLMLIRHSGHIINLSSVAGLIAAPMYSIYGATKFGMRGFTESLRREVTLLGVYVSGIYPGPAITEFGEQSGDNPLKQNFKVPRWLYMTSQYVARKIVNLARHPRRRLILPWWFGPVYWFDMVFPGMVDWILKPIVKNLRGLNHPHQELVDG
jgi:short-subunit dehydrogenase